MHDKTRFLFAILSLFAVFPSHVRCADSDNSTKAASGPRIKWLAEPGGPSSAVRDVSQAFKEPRLMPGAFADRLMGGLRETQPVTPDFESKAWREKFRGAKEVAVYRNAAPAVVLIVMGGGRSIGSGFLISKEGWIVTNHHVAKEALLQDDLTRQVTVIFGRLNEDGLMEAIGERHIAEVCKWDKVRDLALLKLKDKAPDSASVLKIASAGTPPGTDVAAIGNAGVTLLWSLKPGQVQAVGKNIDSAALLAEWDKQAQGQLRDALGGTYAEVKRQVETELGPNGRVLLVQATCPILHGDSGGPLLNMDAEVIGVNDFFRVDQDAGHANYFIHAREVKEFLKQMPADPMTQAPAFWETEAQACEIKDLDDDGRPETIGLFTASPSKDGMRKTLVGVGWDLSEESKLEKYIRKSALADLSEPSEIDGEAVYHAEAMHLHAYMVKINGSWLVAYDLDGDGYFEHVRMEKAGKSSCLVLQSGGAGKGWQKQSSGESAGLFLSSDRVPAKWRQRYQRVVIDFFAQREKNVRQ